MAVHEHQAQTRSERLIRAIEKQTLESERQADAVNALTRATMRQNTLLAEILARPAPGIVLTAQPAYAAAPAAPTGYSAIMDPRTGHTVTVPNSPHAF